MRLLFLFLVMSLVVSACTTCFDERVAVCRTLKSKIVFSGGTSDTRQAEIQNAEQPLARDTFDEIQCDSCRLVKKKHKSNPVS